MIHLLMTELVSLGLDGWLWKGEFDGPRLYSIAGPGDSDCPYECAEDLVSDNGMASLTFENGEVIDIIYPDVVRGYQLALDRNRVHPVDWEACLGQIITRAKHHDERCKKVVRDTVLFAAYGEDRNE